jgi:TolB protein
MKYLLPILLFFTVSSLAQNPIGIFQNHKDIGKPSKPGSASYDATTQVYTIKGAGYNIWFNRDEFHYLYKTIKGDFILTANFEFVGKGTNIHRKIGWMVRESDADDVAHMTATNHGDGLAVLQWRALRGAYMRDPEDELFAIKSNPQIIQLERTGKKLTMRIANVGEPLQTVGTQEMPYMRDSVLAGIFICSHDSAVTDEAKVWNVRIDRPVPNTAAAERQGGVGCRLEIMNVFTGVRKVIRESKIKFEAPNWMPDGKHLLFNEGGFLYKIPVDGGDTVKLNTGAVARNNNDHGISFDGKMLAISSHRTGLAGGGSSVYVLPLSGGEPKLLTENTPSYWHGWNPNGKELVYVGMRDGKNYDIYKIPVNGGNETKLTSNDGYHVDGPEYSPDGKYIYYNGSQSGTMQIWRMKPDGTNHEQITFDEYNNWFPHMSPDGRWMVMISFPPDINPKDHPSYKRVMLRLMPVSGGAPRVIAYLYGGQGTINVPSWSPDSKAIAFVSNSEKAD